MSDRIDRGSRGSWIRSALFAGVLIGGSVATDAQDPSRTTQSYTVKIANMRFEPAELVVKRGSRIVWVNEDLFPHTATAVGKTFDSGSIAAGEAWAYAPAEPGTHEYVCALHPTMKGRLIVR